MKRIAIPLLILLSLAACAQPARTGVGSGATTPPDGVVSTTEPPGSVPNPGGPMLPVMVTPRPGLIDVHPVHWLKTTPSADGQSMTVSFWGGPCVAVDHVAVAETAATITVTLYEGTPPSAVHAACPELAVLQGVRVALQSPVAGRAIVDGAPEEVPPASPPVGGGIGGSPGTSVPPDAPAA